LTFDEDIYFKIRDEAYSLGIGNTPLARLDLEGRVKIHAKLEYFNRFRSVKDRASFFMIKSMIYGGNLSKDNVIVEASSGNTGIAIANIASLLGIRAEMIIPAGSSEETKEAVRLSGQTLIEMEGDRTPGARISIDPAIARAKSIVRGNPQKYVNLDQYSNPNNTLSHYYTTGPEITRDLKGENPSHVVVGIGTGGTLTGLARYFKKVSPETKIVAVEPVPDHHIQGLKNLSVSAVPKLIEENRNLVDEWISVTDEMAIAEVRNLLWENRLFVGLSSGANMAGVRIVAKRMNEGRIVTIFPDSAEKYRSVYVGRKIFTQDEFAANIHLVKEIGNA
jgi:cysteine synthase